MCAFSDFTITMVTLVYKGSYMSAYLRNNHSSYEFVPSCKLVLQVHKEVKLHFDITPFTNYSS